MDPAHSAIEVNDLLKTTPGGAGAGGPRHLVRGLGRRDLRL